jgi:hypothetical protein
MRRRLRRWLRQALVDGSVASIASSIVIVAASHRHRGAPASGTNATSHWLWGAKAQRRDRPSWRYTAVGYAIHHASSVFWAAVYEGALARRPASSPRNRALLAACVGLLAWVVDYHVVPRRLTPGFERHFPRKSMLATYVAFSGGLAWAAIMLRRTR